MTLYSKRRQFTKEEDQIIISMRLDGASFEVIGKRIGCAKGLISQRAQDIGCYVQDIKREWTIEDDAKIRILLARGETYAEAGRVLGRTDHAVRRRAGHLGVTSMAPRVTPRLKKTVEKTPPRAQDNEPIVSGPTIVDLTACQCRWPIGVNADAEYVFCGAERTSRAYCERHVKIAWRARP